MTKKPIKLNPEALTLVGKPVTLCGMSFWEVTKQNIGVFRSLKIPNINLGSVFVILDSLEEEDELCVGYIVNRKLESLIMQGSKIVYLEEEPETTNNATDSGQSQYHKGGNSVRRTVDYPKPTTDHRVIKKDISNKNNY